MTWTSRIPAITAAALPKAQAAVTAAAAQVEAHAKTTAPVDTGNLRSSIQARPAGALAADVVAQAEYAIYQEFGTYKMAAQPFMGPAAEAVRPAFEAAMRQVIS